MTSRNFKQSMVNQDQEIIFEVVKVSGSWVFPAASSIVEATRGKNMYLRLTDDGRSDIFRLDSVKDGENAGETVFGFVGNGGMDLVELTATTDGTGATTGSWDYEPGEGPAGEAIGNLGQPLQWKGPATVAQLNAGITGIQPGWTYTLTDAGTLTDGSVTVDVGDEVAWTEDGDWFKVGGENSKVALFQFTGTDYPDGDAVLAEQQNGKTVVLAKYVSGYGGYWYDYYYMDRRVNGNIGGVSATQLEFYPADNSKQYIKAFKDLDAAEPTWVWTMEDTNVTNMIRDVELERLTNLPIAANTLRFKFSKMSYNPTVAGVGSGGTWKKLDAKFNNVWDWTRSNVDWSASFNESFVDPSNKVSVIAAGDTSSVTNLFQLFRLCSSLVDCCLINTSNVTRMASMFSSTNIKKIPLFNTGNVTDVQYMFYNCFNVEDGALALYQQMSTQTTPPSLTTNCFVNCGMNTATGAAELEQIPASWGGKLPNP